MTKTRTTVTLSDEVLTALKLRAARRGQTVYEVIEAALRRGLDLDVLENVWARTSMPADDAMELALEAQRAVNKEP